MHVGIHGGDAAHGKSAERHPFRIVRDGEHLLKERKDALDHILVDQREVPVIDGVVHSHDDSRFCPSVRDQIIHDVGKAALAEPVYFVSAASVGNKDQRVFTETVISGWQIDTHRPDIPDDIVIAHVSQRAFYRRIRCRKIRHIVWSAHVELAVHLRSVFRRRVGRIFRIRYPGFEFLQPVIGSVLRHQILPCHTRIRAGFTELIVDLESIRINSGRKFQCDLIKPGFRIFFKWVEVTSADLAHAFLIAGRREFFIALRHTGFVGMIFQIAAIEQELSDQRGVFDLFFNIRRIQRNGYIIKFLLQESFLFGLFLFFCHVQSPISMRI